MKNETGATTSGLLALLGYSVAALLVFQVPSDRRIRRIHRLARRATTAG